MALSACKPNAACTISGNLQTRQSMLSSHAAHTLFSQSSHSSTGISGGGLWHHTQISASRQRRPFAGVHGRIAAAAAQGPAGGDSAERERLKTELIRATANTQRGRRADAQQRRSILEAANALEQLNPTSSPGTSEKINGRWSLLYQGSEEVQDDGKSGEPLEGPLLAFFRPLLGFLFSTQGITQIIDTAGGSVQNLAEFKFAALLRGSLNIIGTVAPAPPRADGGVTRVDVKFTKFRVQLGWIAFSIPLGWANPTGWVETTYVDSSFRIGHGDKGSIFITAAKRGAAR